MTKSLNQAFIKAYSKEKASEAIRQSHEADSQSNESWIVRFDTATCSVPPPHLNTAKRPQAEAASLFGREALPLSRPAGVSGNALPRAAEPARPVVMDLAEDRQESSEELRSTIASQMFKASMWEDQSIDAFIGGFPMVSPSRPAEPIFQPASITNSRSSLDTTLAVANELPEPVRVDPPQREVPESAPPAKMPAKMPEGESAEQISESCVGRSPAVQDSSAARRVELSSESMEPRLQAQVPKGSIFRLDRPSYSNPVSESEEERLSDSDEQSSMIDAAHFNGMPDEVESLPFRSTKSVRNNAKVIESTKAAEESLRRARVRVFNPVWEVDQFQWPEVCLELLEQRSESLNKVARNLIEACQEGLQVLAITSPQSGAGRTTVACCLAKLAGSHGLNVAIVDGDIENPTLSYQTNLDVEQDWKSAIFNHLPLEEIAVHSIDDQVTLLPLVNPIERDEMSSQDDRIAYMLQELSESFDLVVVDMGHMDSNRNLVSSMGEQGIISAVVAVVDHRSSNPQQIEVCLRRIRQTGIASIGLVENFAA